MLGVADTVRVVADGSMVTSPCFQKYQQDSANNVTELSATNTTLAASQLDTVPIQFGANPYSSSSSNSNETVTDATVYEPDVLGVSYLSGMQTCITNVVLIFPCRKACLLDRILRCILQPWRPREPSS